MSNEYVLKARDMSDAIINSEYKGAGDTIEAAAYRASRKHGIDGKQLMRIRHRWHEMKDMRVSLWFAVLNAYQKTCDAAERLYINERAKHEINSTVGRVADLVAGSPIPKKEETKVTDGKKQKTFDF